MEESAAFDQQDRDNLSLELQRGRGLSTLGITTDPASGDLFIHGQPIEDNKLYGIGMTDYLAFGDTGYPELSSEAVLPRVRVASLQGLERLTKLACKQLPASPTAGDCQTREIQASQYFDAIAHRPFDMSPDLTVLRYLRLWATHPFQPQPVSTFISQHNGKPESEAEHRGLWWFTLQNMSLEYDLWTRARGYSFRRFADFYASGEEKYTKSAVRISDASGNGNFGPYQLTLRDNAVRAELGLLSKPLSNRIPIRALVSIPLISSLLLFHAMRRAVYLGLRRWLLSISERTISS